MHYAQHHAQEWVNPRKCVQTVVAQHFALLHARTQASESLGVQTAGARHFV